MAAFHVGAREPEAVGQIARQAAWLAVLVSLALVAVLSLDGFVFRALGLDARVMALADAFVDAICFGLPAACLYQVLRFVGAATGRTVPIMMLSVAALPLNAVLNWVLMYGPRGPGAWAAAATTIVHWVMCLGLGLWLMRAPVYRPLALCLCARWEWPVAAELMRLLRLGLPMGIGIFLEASLFGSAALMIGALGTAPAAAHQIAINYAALMCMVPLGVSLAMTVRIGHALGAGGGARVRSIGTLGYALCLAFALASAAVMLAFPVSIVRFYTDDPAVLPIAVGLIGMAAVFQVSDGLQVAALGALRGLRDTRGPMLINAAAYWGIGFPCAWLFGIALHHGPRAVWAGLVLGLTLAAMLLLGRFYRLTRAGSEKRG